MMSFEIKFQFAQATATAKEKPQQNSQLFVELWMVFNVCLFNFIETKKKLYAKTGIFSAPHAEENRWPVLQKSAVRSCWKYKLFESHAKSTGYFQGHLQTLAGVLCPRQSYRYNQPFGNPAAPVEFTQQ